MSKYIFVYYFIAQIYVIYNQFISLFNQIYLSIYSKLIQIIKPSQIKCDPVYLHSYARDASFYRLVPKAVVLPEKNKDIQSLFQFANQYLIPLTFRAGGTSLSGQSITNNILADISHGWKTVKTNDNGKLITLGASVVGGHANEFLKKYNRKIGPDPASINSCFIGGIISNNASGMCCGVTQNSYNTLQAIKIILPSGTIIDSSQNDLDIFLKEKENKIYNGLLELRDDILNKPELIKLIMDKFSIKNTMGYSINSFIDYELPADILSHLMVGSEGTLGFISEVSLKTVLDPKLKATGLIIFKNLVDACKVITALIDLGVDACEIMDYSALKVLETSVDFSHKFNNIPKGSVGLLCEFQSENEFEINKRIGQVLTIISKEMIVQPFSFSINEEDRNILWKLRKELLPCHAGLRRHGTTLIIEDVCVKVEQLAYAIDKLHILFTKFNYKDAILFGHAKDGNLHFNITSDFSSERGIKKYKLFMNDVVDLISEELGGSLKAEHGTGRNMAPFLEKEWGTEAVQIMKKVKHLFDPNNILNPGVIFNKDRECHIKNIKPIPSVNPIIDSCIECGFCESQCPSKNLTMTPRRRINILRELKLLKTKNENQTLISEIYKNLEYELSDTCAADGLCSIACPVNIDTGQLTKIHRGENRSAITNGIALSSVKYFRYTTKLLKYFGMVSNSIGKIIGWNNLKHLSTQLNKMTERKFPIISKPINILNIYLPSELKTSKPKMRAIYFPSCITRQMQSEAINRVTDNIKSICQKADIDFTYPQNIFSLCCGMPYSSKGFDSAFEAMTTLTTKSLLNSVRNRDFIITDNSPCALTLKKQLKALGKSNIRILDPTEFLNDVVLPNVSINRKIDSLYLHVPCSSAQQNLSSKAISVASNLTKNIEFELDSYCCGMAGDLGYFIPELTESAGQIIKNRIELKNTPKHFCSTSITCESSLNQTTGLEFESLLSLVDKSLK